MDCIKVNLNRSKSTGNLDENHDHHYYMKRNIKCSPRVAMVNGFGGDNEYTFSNELFDSGLGRTDEALSILENKLDRLSGMLREQQILLNTLKDEIAIYNHTKRMLDEESCSSKDSHESVYSQDSTDRAKNFLDAIELKQTQYLNLEIKEAVTKFLESDDLKDRVANTTADSVKSVISDSFMKTFPTTYIPILDKFHTRLLKYVTRILHNAFRELEGNTSYFHKSVHKTSQALRIALENHESLLHSVETEHAADVKETLYETLEDVLKMELADWRQKLLNVLTSQALPRPEFPEPAPPASPSPDAPCSPAQPADPDKSIIEQLLRSAEINKLIKDGKINEAFEKALSSSDLSLVMAACRAADPAKVFAPCCLPQSTLLSLVQQLATDMVHDTRLKCRYLEEAIINLDTEDAATRSHLPLVVGEVRKHLSTFLQTYPSHVASRRISLIILAADNLLK